MPDPTFGLATASLLSAGVSGVGARRAEKRADKSAAASLAFDQKKYDDWKAIYGDVEQNLADFYNNLTPAYFEARGIEAFNKEKEAAVASIRENFTQRGIRMDSAIALGAESALEMTGAIAKAEIRATSEQKVADARSSFMTLGVSRDPSNQLGTNLAQRAQNDASNASSAATAAGNAINSAIKTTATALGDYYDRPTSTPTTALDMPVVTQADALALDGTYVSDTPSMRNDTGSASHE